MKYCIICLLALLLVGCGKDGAQGPAGQNGSTYDITSVKDCSVANLGLAFEYNLTGFSNNNYFVEASVSGTTTASETRYFKTTNSNNIGEELVYYTIPGDSNNGAWAFVNTNNVITVTYHNTGSTHDGFSFTFTSGQCFVQ